MSKFSRHILLPALAPMAMVALSLTPVSAFGCKNRGLMAMGVVLVSALVAFISIGIGMRARVRNQESTWWLLSTLILILPLVLILGPLG